MSHRRRHLVAAVTGASSGIGMAAALAFAGRGDSVALIARDQAGLNVVEEDCRSLGAKALVIPADVTDETAVRDAARRIVDIWGRVDVWVNNAGVYAVGRFEDTPSDAFRRVIETNFLGCVNGARAVIPYFRRQGHGVLINVSSMLGKVAAPYLSAYSASKFAVAGFSQSLRAEMSDSPDIHVCTVFPASVNTPFYQHSANYTRLGIKAMSPAYSPECVAREIVSLARNPAREVIIGAGGKALARLGSLSQAAAEKVLAARVRRDHFTGASAQPEDGNLFESPADTGHVFGGWKRARGWPGAAGPALLAAAAAGLGLYMRYSRDPRYR